MRTVPRLIPCLLIQDRTLVKTIQFRDSIYVGDPINVVKIFNDKQVDELVLLDIKASKENKGPDLDFLERISREAFMPLSYGGGIADFATAKRILGLGFEKVILNTVARNQPDILREMSSAFGSQSVVASIDVEKDAEGCYKVYDHILGRANNCKAVDLAVQCEQHGAGEILLTSVDRDGTFSGYEIPSVSEISSTVHVPVIACGGLGNLQHFAVVIEKGGASAAAAGSFFVFYGISRSVLITYPSPQEIERLWKSTKAQ